MAEETLRRNVLTAEQEANLKHLSASKKLKNDSGFADMEDEDVDEVDACQEMPREDPAISQLTQQTVTRLTLKSHGNTSSNTACTQQDSRLHEQAQQYKDRVRNVVRNREANENGDTLLHVAIIHRRDCPTNLAEFVIQLAPDSSYLDSYNNLHQTPLHLAVIVHDSKLVRALLEKGARIDIPDRFGRLPLHIACENGDIGCITELTRVVHDPQFALRFPNTKDALDMTVNATNYDGFTALQVAAKGGFKNIVHYLVQRCGADVDMRDSRSGRAALHHAVEARDLEMVSHLVIRCNANLDATTLDECTPLHLSTGMRLPGITNFLIAAGADTTLENLAGDLPSL